MRKRRSSSAYRLARHQQTVIIPRLQTVVTCCVSAIQESLVYTELRHESLELELFGKL